MRIKYFPDTDTALMEFSELRVAETKEINENIYVDLDASGNLVAMTIEHARQQASLPSLSYEQIDEQTPDLGGSTVSPCGSPPPSIHISVTSTHSKKLAWFRNYFRPHFDDWIIGPINRLVHTQDALIGFIFMACVIDYLAGFWWGKSTKGRVENAYTGFIDEYFPNSRYDAKGLYDSLRNGLVHMFTIKNKKYALTHNNPSFHLTIDRNTQINLNAGDFRDDLIEAKKRYFDDVEAKPALLDNVVDRYLRDGFLDLVHL